MVLGGALAGENGSGKESRRLEEQLRVWREAQSQISLGNDFKLFFWASKVLSSESLPISPGKFSR